MLVSCILYGKEKQLYSWQVQFPYNYYFVFINMIEADYESEQQLIQGELF